MKLTIGTKVRYLGPRTDVDKSVIYTVRYVNLGNRGVGITEDSTSWVYLVHPTHLAPISKLRR